MSPMEQLFSLPCIPLPTFPQNKLGITQTNYVPNDPSERNGEKSQGNSRSFTNPSQVTCNI